MTDTTQIKRYRKKPVVVEAIQYTGENRDVIKGFVGNNFIDWILNFAIDTPEGTLQVLEGDWVIRGTAGEFYPCKDDIFKDIYEEA